MTDTSATTWRTIEARYAGSCPGCSGRFPAGSTVRHVGRGLTFHDRDECTAEAATMPPKPRRSPRSSRARIGRYGGRCTHEDYPCCGC